MSLIYEERVSDSPYIETVTHGCTVGAGVSIRPAESHWHMVFVQYQGDLLPIFTGALTTSGVVKWTEGAEILWIRFKLGAFMPHLSARNLLDQETILPEASSRSFWLKSSAWQFPTYDNVETFVHRLAHAGVLAFDPMISAAFQDRPQDSISPRTLRHRFLHTTGMSQNTIRQIERAQRAAALLRQGVSILDTVYEAGYFDQPHLTRALKQFVGYTPAQIIRGTQEPSVQETANPSSLQA